MRAQDREPFEERHTYADDDAANGHLDQLLGLNDIAIRHLSRELEGDLDPARLGIGWWHTHLDDHRRILIGDHLVQCANTMTTNLREAALHRLEYEGAVECESRRLARMLNADRTLQHPIPEKAADLLPALLMDLHRGGLLRALGSVLDCVAATIVGVQAIPVPI